LRDAGAELQTLPYTSGWQGAYQWYKSKDQRCTGLQALQPAQEWVFNIPGCDATGIQCSRTIGNALVEPYGCTATPEVCRYAVTEPKHNIVLIATSSVWDGITDHLAIQLAHLYVSPLAAAEAILEAASGHTVAHHRNLHDLTCIVLFRQCCVPQHLPLSVFERTHAAELCAWMPTLCNEAEADGAHDASTDHDELATEAEYQSQPTQAPLLTESQRRSRVFSAWGNPQRNDSVLQMEQCLLDSEQQGGAEGRLLQMGFD